MTRYIRILLDQPQIAMMDPVLNHGPICSWGPYYTKPHVHKRGVRISLWVIYIVGMLCDRCTDVLPVHNISSTIEPGVFPGDVEKNKRTDHTRVDMGHHRAQRHKFHYEVSQGSKCFLLTHKARLLHNDLFK